MLSFKKNINYIICIGIIILFCTLIFEFFDIINNHVNYQQTSINNAYIEHRTCSGKVINEWNNCNNIRTKKNYLLFDVSGDNYQILSSGIITIKYRKE